MNVVIMTFELETDERKGVSDTEQVWFHHPLVLLQIKYINVGILLNSQCYTHKTNNYKDTKP
jgi:hypothetical protein